jgi:crotonobetainyl-CoA:carnitine CoA-transferase CaiB-like acyl-CoA transferase
VSSLPLSGMRVVDVSAGIAGPMCGKLLADAGAQVTKVELPPGDPARAFDPPLRWFEFLNRGKRHVGAEPESAEVADLLAEAHVFLTSQTHRHASGSGLDCPTLLQRHPRLVAACVTPFGQTGPYEDYVADDLVLSALAGLADATPGFPDSCARADDPPVQSLAPLAEMAGGIVGATALFGALLGRARGGAEVRHVEVAVHEVAASFMVWEWGMAAYGGGIRGRRPVPADLAPNCYLPCLDGHVVLVAFTEPHWRGLVDLLGNPDWTADPAYADAALRAEHWDSLGERLAEWARGRRGLDVLDGAQARGIPCCCSFELRDTVRTRQVEEYGSLERDGAPAFPADPIVVNAERRRPSNSTTKAFSRETVEPAGTPLAGVRVLDLGQVVAGPFAGQLLAALGAEVIVVESRAHPVSRLFGPFVGEPKHDASMMFHQVNRGKASVEVDLTTAEGGRVLLELVGAADVVLENFSRRAAERLGVTYEELSKVRDDIILASISGFGRRGPWGDYVALHSGVILLSGLASVTRDAQGEMRLAGAIYPDLLAGAYLALAIQEALLSRMQSGRGCHVEVGMLDVLLTCMGGLVPAAVDGMTFGPHAGRFLRTAEPAGYLAVSDAAVDEREVARLTRREAMERLQARGTKAGAVLDIGEVMTDPHLVARGFVVEGDHPLAGPRPMPAVPWLYDGERPQLGHAPLLGDRTAQVLTEVAKLSHEEVEALRLDGVLA